MIDGFKKVISQLVEEVEGLRASIATLLQSAKISIRFDNFRLGKFLEQYGDLVETLPNGEQKYEVGPTHFGRLRQLDRALKSATVAEKLLPGSLLVTLVSRYDAFLGRLIRQMVLTRPELLKSSDRMLSLDTLLSLGEFDAARDFLIEKEIEIVLRKSHADQFAWLETKLDMPLRKDLPSWPAFIELTERRNLLVHCDGIVSHQYLANCKEHSVAVEDCEVGKQLTVETTYFREACDRILEIAVKLTHVVWRKLLPNDREASDDALTQTCIDLLINENYRLANELLCFSTAVLKKYASERHRLIHLVNCAQSFKWLGNDKECLAQLGKEDWSAKGLEFRICVAVLKEDYEDVVNLMKQIGKDGPVGATGYREWPVFRKARKNAAFQEAYEQVFGEKMHVGESVLSIKSRDVQEFFEELGRDDRTKDGSPVSSLTNGKALVEAESNGSVSVENM